MTPEDIEAMIVQIDSQTFGDRGLLEQMERHRAALTDYAALTRAAEAKTTNQRCERCSDPVFCASCAKDDL